MIKEFKSSNTQFNMFIGIAIFAAIGTIFTYIALNTIIMMLPVFAILWTIIAFWGKDRVIITMHKDYFEAKEAIAAKKKLIRYKDVVSIKVNSNGKIVTVYLENTNKNKERINLNIIEKTERNEFIELLTARIA
ncbi:hypothetical protein [Lacinutrix mariniflava]|uniref:hypothetical protein n=1 Tax=Lacinutrix mariniflava TaxID=342955 RepID=UPI0006E367DA|nr:hypothetical protein [Lacinutrix mariniflava]